MKLHDFGLWFNSHEGWFSAPPEEEFEIYYDGERLGRQYPDFSMEILRCRPYKIKLKRRFPKVISHKFSNFYDIGRDLDISDFEIVVNTKYKGHK
jgi:hypothetical protein